MQPQLQNMTGIYIKSPIAGVTLSPDTSTLQYRDNDNNGIFKLINRTSRGYISKQPLTLELFLAETKKYSYNNNSDFFDKNLLRNKTSGN